MQVTQFKWFDNHDVCTKWQAEHPNNKIFNFDIKEEGFFAFFYTEIDEKEWRSKNE